MSLTIQLPKNYPITTTQNPHSARPMTEPPGTLTENLFLTNNDPVRTISKKSPPQIRPPQTRTNRIMSVPTMPKESTGTFSTEKPSKIPLLRERHFSVSGPSSKAEGKRRESTDIDNIPQTRARAPSWIQKTWNQMQESPVKKWAELGNYFGFLIKEMEGIKPLNNDLAFQHQKEHPTLCSWLKSYEVGLIRAFSEKIAFVKKQILEDAKHLKLENCIEYTCLQRSNDYKSFVSLDLLIEKKINNFFIDDLHSQSSRPPQRLIDLNFEGLGLIRFPQLIFKHGIESLSLKSNKISIIPFLLSDMTSLKHLDLSNNSITKIPRSLKLLVNLESLNLTNNNKLNDLPDVFTNFPRLKTLAIDSFLFDVLPSSFKGQKAFTFPVLKLDQIKHEEEPTN